MLKGLAYLIFFTTLQFDVNAQKIRFVIQGKIERIKRSQVIQCTIDDSILKCAIREDGTFCLRGVANKPTEITIRTDSSISEFMWIEKGIINIRLLELPKVILLIMQV
jgi:hypothetical protein